MRNKEQESLLKKKMKLWNLHQKGCFSKVSKVLGHTHTDDFT